METKTVKKTKKKGIVPYSKIELLNLPEKETGAYVAVHLKTRHGNTSFNNSEYQIKISDCSNTVLLHGSLSNPLSRKNAIHKLDAIISNLTDFKENIKSQLKENRLNIKA